MKKKEDNLLHSLATRQNSVPNAQLKITSLNRFNPKQTSMVSTCHKLVFKININVNIQETI